MNGAETIPGIAALKMSAVPPGDETIFWLLVALLAAVVMFGTFCSYLLLRHLARRRWHDHNEPMLIFSPFKMVAGFTFPGDYPCRWLVVRSHLPAVVLEALQVTKATPCSWEEGLARTFDRKLFISPPVNGWIMVLGMALPDPAGDIDACYQFLTQVSRKLGQVQFFDMNRALNHHAWARLEHGRVVRGYAWAGQTLWNEGPVTPAENTLSLHCLDYLEEPEAATPKRDPLTANTEKVPLLAARWGVDPAALGRSLLDERRGLTGELPVTRQQI
jgi:hypothetical protein